MKRTGRPWNLVLLLSVAVSPSLAGFPKAVKKEAKRMTKEGILFLRVDAPCATGRHMYGTYKRPLVEVSPDGVNTEGDMAVNYGWWHADSTYWGVTVNDAVKVDEIEFDDGQIELELEGAEDDDLQTVIRFVDIRSVEDLRKAFDRAFARVPLQEEHEDWPDEIKEAIADDRLVEGMTKRQAYYVTGSPESFDTREDDGVEIETWMLRQSKGMKMGYWRGKGGEGTGLPSSIRFVDGRLASLSSGGGQLDLDD